MNDVVKTERHGRVAVVSMNRPEVLNALDASLCRATLEALADLGRSNDVGAVVLTGEGRAFCAGADLRSTAETKDDGARRSPRRIHHDFNPVIETIGKLDKPVIAAVRGSAAGIGMSFALACDLMVMAKDAYLLAPFVGIGLIPDGGATWTLVRRLGYARAFEFITDPKHRMSADAALAAGLANRVVDSEQVRDEAIAWGAKLAELPPVALSLTKRAARLAMHTSFPDFLTVEAELQGWCTNTEDCLEAVQAFVEKRPAVFKGK
jgi:2-(1,2-epoxy-1,2-dihydrophenyl)acetyl-CoA isomerase